MRFSERGCKRAIRTNCQREAGPGLDGSSPIEIEVLISHSPAAGVLEHVAASGVDLVAMATHGRQGLARAALGSIADKVIRGSHTPVLIVHPTEGELLARSEEVA